MNSQQNVCNDQMIQEMNPSYEQPTDCLPKICVTKIKQGKQIGIAQWGGTGNKRKKMIRTKTALIIDYYVHTYLKK